MSDAYHLERFIDAQAKVYEKVVDELRAGRKRSHWMWFIFPQIKGLGMSGTAQKYAISSLDEAKAYSADPTLGARLRECAALVVAVEGRSAEEIFGYPDVLKFRSCMTLFERGSSDKTLFAEALVKYHGGEPDQTTLEILKRLDS